MKTTLIKLMMILSTISIMMKTPMSMGLLLLIQTMLTIIFINKMMTSSWFILITFLMMVGGLLILFTYMSSIASNEKFKLNMKMILVAIMMTIMYDELMIQNQIKESQEIWMDKLEKLSLNKMYNKTMTMTLMMVLYLLLTMIVIAKIVKHHEGPLRSKNYE